MKFSGVVKKGSSRGKSLGFPTANLDAPDDIPNGLYVGFVNKFPALIFVGANITFDETDRRIEIYLLDFDLDIYGHEVEGEILKKLRNPIKFESGEKLTEQMKKDREVARDFFANYTITN
jgi:riboflavin kinase/FMN adenylyltransferase